MRNRSPRKTTAKSIIPLLYHCPKECQFPSGARPGHTCPRVYPTAFPVPTACDRCGTLLHPLLSSCREEVRNARRNPVQGHKDKARPAHRRLQGKIYGPYKPVRTKVDYRTSRTAVTLAIKAADEGNRHADLAEQRDPNHEHG